MAFNKMRAEIFLTYYETEMVYFMTLLNKICKTSKASSRYEYSF